MTETDSTDTPLIALDAMGGDHGSKSTTRAAAVISKTTDIRLLLVGNREELLPLLEKYEARLDRIEFLHTTDFVPMDEGALASARRTSSSIALAAQSVASGRAQALVTAGNTAAVLLHCSRVISQIPGINRTVLAAVHPTLPREHNADPLGLLLDVGANLSCDAEDLVQFAAMGAAYASRISKTATPTVGLLNIGEEESKGDALLRQAHQLLREASGQAFNFYGNVEGRDIPLGVVDVVVCPGILGNVVLKLLESMGEVVLALGNDMLSQRPTWRLGRRMLRGGLHQISDMAHYSEYGGAPILGLERIVIKAHGRSDAKAIENAIKVAAKAVRTDVCGGIVEAIAKAQENRFKSLSLGTE
ncbi:MAG: phosphate acyltransferase PlsX [Deltaproteobacteria bacterium]|nr:phosphate acyltransferase PlsX [Deltaproteobacteria bacterium]